MVETKNQEAFLEKVNHHVSCRTKITFSLATFANAAGRRSQVMNCQIGVPERLPRETDQTSDTKTLAAGGGKFDVAFSGCVPRHGVCDSEGAQPQCIGQVIQCVFKSAAHKPPKKRQCSIRATSSRYALAFWSVPVLWSFSQAGGRSKAPEDRRSPGRYRGWCRRCERHGIPSYQPSLLLRHRRLALLLGHQLVRLFTNPKVGAG